MIRKHLTTVQKEEQRKRLIQIVRSPIYTKKQKRIAASKWRFNQMGDEYREIHAKEYQRKWREMEAQPDSAFEDITLP